MADIDLRAFVYIDILQPQVAAFLQTVSQGFQPLDDQAALYVETAPGIVINRLTDVALKATSVYPGMQIVERAFGLLDIHHFDQGQVRAAGDAILDFLQMDEKARLRPVIKSSETITGLTGYQSMHINRMRHGDLFRQGDTLYVLEMHPAGYCAFAANEAEKAANIRILELRSFGAFGRLYLGGSEEEIAEAAKGAVQALRGLEGRANPEPGI